MPNWQYNDLKGEGEEWIFEQARLDPEPKDRWAMWADLICQLWSLEDSQGGTLPVNLQYPYFWVFFCFVFLLNKWDISFFTVFPVFPFLGQAGSSVWQRPHLLSHPGESAPQAGEYFKQTLQNLLLGQRAELGGNIFPYALKPQDLPD